MLDAIRRARHTCARARIRLVFRPHDSARTAHAGLRITAAEWEISIEYTQQAMKNQGIGEREMTEVIAIFEQYRTDIVEA